MSYFLKNRRVFIIAELGVNHNGDVQLAKKMISSAKSSGADAVKFQTWITDENTSCLAPKAEHQKNGIGDTQSQYDLIKKLELCYEEHCQLRDWARQEGIIFFSKPGSPGAVELLSKLNMELIKIGSPDLTNLPLITRTAALGLPLIISTGMGSLDEIALAVATAEETGNRELMLMHCTTAYPAPHDDLHLKFIETLQEKFAYPVGYSDHSDGWEASVAAVALGSCAIEKHFTLDKKLPGPDHRASLEPAEFKELVLKIRNTERALGLNQKKLGELELANRQTLRRSIVVVETIPAGTVLTSAHLAVKRPGTGLPPSRLTDLIGRITTRDLAVDTLLGEDDVK